MACGATAGVLHRNARFAVANNLDRAHSFVLLFAKHCDLVKQFLVSLDPLQSRAIALGGVSRNR